MNSFACLALGLLLLNSGNSLHEPDVSVTNAAESHSSDSHVSATPLKRNCQPVDDFQVPQPPVHRTLTPIVGQGGQSNDRSLADRIVWSRINSFDLPRPSITQNFFFWPGRGRHSDVVPRTIDDLIMPSSILFSERIHRHGRSLPYRDPTTGDPFAR